MAGLRILRLTRQEEKRLIERLENIESLNDLEKLQQRMYEQLGIRLAWRNTRRSPTGGSMPMPCFAMFEVLCGWKPAKSSHSM